MSNVVREWLRALGLLPQTTHADREAIDREIEWVTGVNCDEALERRMMTKEEFEELVKRVLKARKEKQEFKGQVEKLFDEDKKAKEGPPDRFSEQRRKAKEIWKTA